MSRGVRPGEYGTSERKQRDAYDESDHLRIHLCPPSAENGGSPSRGELPLLGSRRSTDRCFTPAVRSLLPNGPCSGLSDFTRRGEPRPSKKARSVPRRIPASWVRFAPRKRRKTSIDGRISWTSVWPRGRVRARFAHSPATRHASLPTRVFGDQSIWRT